LKKETVDLAKTEAANVPPAPPAQAKPEAPAATPEKAKAQPKKPARVYTQKDLERLRGEHDLGSGTFAEGSDASQTQPADQKAADKEAKKAEEREKKAEDLRKRIDQAQKDYDSLSKQCDYMKTLNFQTNKIYDDKGNALPFYDTIKSTCDNADKVKAAIDQMNQELSTLQ
jgi:vacuolar-type H+-ATPase subunit I/STV1